MRSIGPGRRSACTSCSRRSASADAASASSISAPGPASSRASSRGAARSSAASTSHPARSPRQRASANAEGLAIDFVVAAAEACPFADARLRRHRRQSVLDVLRRRAHDRRGASAARSRWRAGDDALQLAPSRRPDRARKRSAGAARESGLAGRRLVGPDRHRAGVGRRQVRGARDVLVRRRRAVHARELARPHARVPRRRRDLPPADVDAFDAALAAWLDANAPPRLHRPSPRRWAICSRHAGARRVRDRDGSEERFFLRGRPRIIVSGRLSP